MTGPLVIEGWKCELHYDGNNMVIVREAVAPNGRVAHHVPGKWTAIHDAMPPAVLAWLIRPLLHEAWADGSQQASAETLAGFPPRPNPHVDSGGTDGTG